MTISTQRSGFNKTPNRWEVVLVDLSLVSVSASVSVSVCADITMPINVGDRHRDVKYCTEIGTSALFNNKRFRQLDVVTKDRAELTYFHGKRKVLADGLSTAPLEV